MSPEAQRIAIATACGWTPYPADNVGAAARLFNGDVWYRHAESSTVATPAMLPDYCNDLNAMNEAEKSLTPDQWLQWERVVASMSLPRGSVPLTVWIARMTAAQRAEAFLRTLNLWTE